MKIAELKDLHEELRNVYIKLSSIYSNYEVERKDQTNIKNHMNRALDYLDYACQEAETELKRLKKVEKHNKYHFA